MCSILDDPDDGMRYRGYHVNPPPLAVPRRANRLILLQEDGEGKAREREPAKLGEN